MVAAATGARYLVNGAGVIRLRPILESGVADMREIYPVNVEAVWDLPPGWAGPCRAAECAGIIWFLLSDEAGYMTGQAVNITGGEIMF